jgi:hypothetical protein
MPNELLTVGNAAVSLLSSLNRCWNSVYRKIIWFNQWESVKTFIFRTGIISFQNSALNFVNVWPSQHHQPHRLCFEFTACVIVRMIYVCRSLSNLFTEYISLLFLNFSLVSLYILKQLYNAVFLL